jgi:hypothetical protein
VILLVAELLSASQEGLCSMEFAISQSGNDAEEHKYCGGTASFRIKFTV